MTLPPGFSRDYTPPVNDFQPPQAPQIQLQPQQVAPKFGQQQPASAQDILQNENDLYNGPLLEQLGIDPKMIVQKFLTALPFQNIPDCVAICPEMTISLIIILFIALLSVFSSKQISVPLFFSLLLGGSILFKLLINLLLQGERSVDLYNSASALCYSLIPVLICQLVYAVTNIVIIAMLGVPLSAFMLAKQLDAILNISQHKLLIAIPSVLFATFWFLAGAGVK